MTRALRGFPNPLCGQANSVGYAAVIHTQVTIFQHHSRFWNIPFWGYAKIPYLLLISILLSMGLPVSHDCECPEVQHLCWVNRLRVLQAVPGSDVRLFWILRYILLENLRF